jgi:hypothetical protein
VAPTFSETTDVPKPHELQPSASQKIGSHQHHQQNCLGR